MESSLQSDLPASAKVLSLVRIHYGLSADGSDEVPVKALMKCRKIAQIWRIGAKLNHLNARRRRIRLEDVPERAFPVVLELGKGSQFLILKQRIEGPNAASYLVQFPDSRESLVRAERIREVYDGTCVFFSLRDSPRHGDTGSGGRPGGLLRRTISRIFSLPMKRGFVAAFLCHLITLAGTLAVGFSHRMAFPAMESPSLLVPTMGVFMAAVVFLGILRIRRETLTERVSTSLVDSAFIPLYGLAMFILAGWSATPFFWIAGLVAVCLLLSDRLGQIPSRLRGSRSFILTATFLSGAAGCWICAFLGLLNPAVMAGVIVLGTCLVNLFIECEVLCQEVRLAAIC